MLNSKHPAHAIAAAMMMVDPTVQDQQEALELTLHMLDLDHDDMFAPTYELQTLVHTFEAGRIAASCWVVKVIGLAGEQSYLVVVDDEDYVISPVDGYTIKRTDQ